MLKHLKVFLSLLFVILFTPLVAQPPPSPVGPPNLGDIFPRAITNNDGFRWATVNNTPCNAYFINHFQVLRYNHEGGSVEEILVKEATGVNQPLMVPPGASGAITNLDLIKNWGLDLAYYYEVTAMGVWISFGSMNNYISLDPSGSGGKVYTGQPAPCDCFRYFFEPINNGFQLRLEPVLAPDTCP